jgi:hypothetical protein
LRHVSTATAPWFTRPWVIIFFVAVLGVPGVIIGLTLVAVVFANPVTWFLAGAAWFAIGFRHYRHRLTIRDTPSARIGAAAIGLIEVSGSVRSDAPDTAPISGTPCVYWRVTIEVKRDEGSSSVSRTSTPRCFEIEDATGRVLIWPWASDLIVTKSQRWEGAAATNLATQVQGSTLQDAMPRPGDGRPIVTEQRIEIGATVYVIGELSERSRVTKAQTFGERIKAKLQPQAATGPDARRYPTGLEAAKILVLAVGMVVVMLGTGYFSTPRQDAAAEPPAIDGDQLLIWRGAQDRPFIIADSREGIVIDTLTQWTKLALLGGASVMVGTVILYLGGFFA